MAQTKIPASFMDIVNDKKSFAHLATLMPDGTPQVTPVWFDMAGDKIRVNTARGRIKDRNMQKNAAVALSIIDPENPYRHIAIRGRISNISSQGEYTPRNVQTRAQRAEQLFGIKVLVDPNPKLKSGMAATVDLGVKGKFE